MTSKSRLPSPLIAALIALSLVSLVNLFVRIDGMPGEVALRIDCARLMLQGKTPYVDFFVLDSPVALLLAFVPVKLASLLGIEDGYNFARYTFVFEWLLSISSLALTTKLIWRRKQLRQSLWCRTMLLSIAVFNIACVYQFGQPEHLLMLGLTPYLLARWLEYTGRTVSKAEALLCGTMGGIAILLDPFFLVCPVAIELALITYFMRLPVRLFSPLTALIASASALSAIIAAAGTTMIDNYFSYVHPLVILDRQTFDIRLYGFNSHPDTRPVIYLMLFSSLLVLALRSKNSLSTPLIVLCWLGFSYYVAECKGYFFQAVPMFWCAGLVATNYGALFLQDGRRWARRKRWRNPRPAVIVGCLTALGALAFLFVQHKAQQMADSAHFRLVNSGMRDIQNFRNVLLDQTKPGERVLVFNNNVAPAYPLITLHDRAPGSRILWSFPLPILTRLRDMPWISDSERQRLTKFYFDIIKEDLAKEPPVMIITETGPVNEALNREGVGKIIREHFIDDGEAFYYCDNMPPAEFSNPNFPMQVFKFVI